MMAVGEALVHMRITLLKLCLSILLFLSGWAQIGHSQHHSPPEVVIPLRITGTHRVMRPPEWISYSLYFGGKKHIVHMKAKKLLVSKPFSVFTYTDQGALLEDHPFVKSDCYYDGYVEGDPESLVSLSTCLGGFQGMLEIHDIVYEIKPKRLSTTFEHLVYKMQREKTQFPFMRCGLTEEELARQLKLQRSNNSILRQSGYEGWWTHKWFLETVLVVDYKRFLYRKSNVSHVLEDIFVIVNHIHSLLSPLDVDLCLLGIEVWNEKNLLNVTNDMVQVLDLFCDWKVASLNSRIKNDIAHFLAHQTFDRYIGLAYVGTVCIPPYNCGIESFLGDKLYDISLVITHEMGHNLGKVCRENVSECDLPEWCNGTSPECPEDVYVQDGVRCMDSGYCHEKRCNAHDEQCRQIFGKESRSAQESCYTEMNSRGDRFGNCGLVGENYVRCNKSDFLCGRVQCENVKEITFLRSHTTVHWIDFNGVTCWGTDYHFGMTVPDIGDVKDGTECGAEHVCICQKCVSMSLWTSDCSPETCDRKGICNNKHHCHCDSNWEPPYCIKIGHGGSVDSGPPPGKTVQEWMKKKKGPFFFISIFGFISEFVTFACKDAQSTT
ncbi:hypothetical protein GHT09_002521 [Marmota monax]|uniref:Peptidase M12B domain-containing protein n=1 Tax=Marmota monax TaxID=9995 RepID=A0A834QXV4_MARMO|nr:hypothetical protein GHT09_002521 [Marmota monax]